MKTILFVEDEKTNQLIVQAAIGKVCHLVYASTLAAARMELARTEVDLLLLDGDLPDGDGFDFCQSIRARESYADLPIIFLTARATMESRILGYQSGGDDYITKPIDPTEFRARVVSRLSRSRRPQTTFRQGGYRVDLVSQKVFELLNGGDVRALSLTPIEFKLFSHFLQNEEKIYSRKELLNLFWGDAVHVSGHTVDTHISSLRKKMGLASANLRSIFKQGYCFTTKK